jgi:hypothetical protein
VVTVASDVPRVDESVAHSAITAATNRRQASKLLDVRSSNVLICSRDSGIEVTIAKCDLGLHAIWRNGGVYCDDRHVPAGAVRAQLKLADEIDVEQEPTKATKRITWCDRERGDD